MCEKNISINENSNYSCWENKNTTRDEREIIDYLKQNRDILANKKILHVGIGNSELGRVFSQDALLIDGITISVPEKLLSRKYKCYRNVHICNKYNLEDMNKIMENYDIIIDQGIKQYSCCIEHFNKLFDLYVKKLNDKGMIITSKYGMEWSGYDIKKSININSTNRICHRTNVSNINKFTKTELELLLNKYRLDKLYINNNLFIKK